MARNPAVSSSSTQRATIPQLAQPAVDINSGVFLDPWQRFFTDIYTKLGGAATGLSSAVYFVFNNGVLQAFGSLSNLLIGNIALLNQPGQAAVPQTITGASPFVFTSTGTGTLVIDSGRVEISRDGGINYFLASLVGGAIPVLKNDKVQISWYNEAPTIILLPGSST